MLLTTDTPKRKHFRKVQDERMGKGHGSKWESRERERGKKGGKAETIHLIIYKVE